MRYFTVSTIILGNALPFLGDYHSSLFSVESRKPESLAEYVRRVRQEKGLSTTDVQRQSRQGGLKGISDAYVTRIENEYVTNVSPDKLRALAKGLVVPEDEIFAAARGKSLNGAEAVDAEIAHFASRVKKLTPQQKRDFQIAWRMANELLDRLEREGEDNP
jgi:transcriptional regulator with XRE-family HTH domain